MKFRHIKRHAPTRTHIFGFILLQALAFVLRSFRTDERSEKATHGAVDRNVRLWIARAPTIQFLLL